MDLMIPHRERGEELPSTARVAFSHHEPKINKPELSYVAAERLWIKYHSDHGKTAICTVYCGFQSPDNRHYQWNEGIYYVLANKVRERLELFKKLKRAVEELAIEIPNHAEMFTFVVLKKEINMFDQTLTEKSNVLKSINEGLINFRYFAGCMLSFFFG